MIRMAVGKRILCAQTEKVAEAAEEMTKKLNPDRLRICIDETDPFLVQLRNYDI